jgi:hypothetical protein
VNPRASSQGSTRNTRVEQACVGLTLIALFVLPMINSEPYPLTTAPLFSHPIKQFHLYSLSDSIGQSLNRDEYGLRSNWSWYQEKNFGVVYPPSVVSPPDRPANMERVIEHVRRIGRRGHAKFPLLLRCEVTGSTDGQKVGRLRSREWTIPDW